MPMMLTDMPQASQTPPDRPHSPPKPLVIPIFIPHAGCPHQCLFCNQSAITNEKSIRCATHSDREDDTQRAQQSILQMDNRRPPQIKAGDSSPAPGSCQKHSALPSSEEICNEVDRYLTYKGCRKRIELAFFGGNFLGLEQRVMTGLLETAHHLFKKNKIHGIRFSTRPDTITKERLMRLKEYPITTVELGVQSMSDVVLKISRRGHTQNDTLLATTLLNQFYSRFSTPPDYGNNVSISTVKKGKQVQVGMQMMVGLPGDTPATALESARKIAALSPDFVRIYPLVVLNGSPLATWYKQGKYTPLSLEMSVQLVKKIYKIFHSHGIDVIRMGLQASDLMEDTSIMLAGPWHPAFGHLVHSALFFDQAVAIITDALEKKSYAAHTESQTPHAAILTVHPSSLSKLLGNRKENLNRLAHRFPQLKIDVKTDESVGKEAVALQSETIS